MNRTDVLKQAEKTVSGDRDKEYGPPNENFAVIADLWAAYKGVEFTRVDVGVMMGLLKIARIRTGPGQMDSYVDLAGYAACAAEAAAMEKKVIGNGRQDQGRH